MSALWGQITAEELLAPLEGSCASGLLKTPFAGLGTDSRKIRPKEIFFALKGEKYDGHDFIKMAVERGASGVVVRKDSHWLGYASRDLVVITVDDTLKALGDLAAWWRHQYDIGVVAITGSTGKTTTKEMTAGILGLGSKSLKNQGNFNNLIGLPLTLLKLKDGYKNAVLEMGMNRPKEISRLTEIADPDVGVITNVGMAHLEGVGDLEGVARAKAELIEKISPKGKLVLNGDDELLMKTAAAFSKEISTFGIKENNDVRACNIRDLGRKGVSFDIRFRDNTWPVKLKVPGLQNLFNALAAASAGLCLHEPPEHIVEGLSLFSGLKGRFMVEQLPRGVTLVDDTYNANPMSLKASLDSAAALVGDGSNMIVGLGEMMELGNVTATAHKEAGRWVAQLDARLFLAMGEHSREMIEGAVDAGMPERQTKLVKTCDEMAKIINEEMRGGNLVLLKGSRKMELGKVVESLKRARPMMGRNQTP